MSSSIPCPVVIRPPSSSEPSVRTTFALDVFALAPLSFSEPPPSSPRAGGLRSWRPPRPRRRRRRRRCLRPRPPRVSPPPPPIFSSSFGAALRSRPPPHPPRDRSIHPRGCPPRARRGSSRGTHRGDAAPGELAVHLLGEIALERPRHAREGNLPVSSPARSSSSSRRRPSRRRRPPRRSIREIVPDGVHAGERAGPAVASPARVFRDDERLDELRHATRRSRRQVLRRLRRGALRSRGRVITGVAVRRRQEKLARRGMFVGDVRLAATGEVDVLRVICAEGSPRIARRRNPQPARRARNEVPQVHQPLELLRGRRRRGQG